MTPADVMVLALIASLLAVSGFFAAAEVGFLAVGKLRLRALAEGGSHSASVAARMLERPGVVLSTVLLTITGLNFTAEALMADWAHPRGPWISSVSGVLVFVVVLLFAELAPITYAVANAERVALLAARPAVVASSILWVPVWLLSRVAQGVLWLAGARQVDTLHAVTEDEILALLTLETDTGGLPDRERRIIHSIFDFGDTVVREVMVPRGDIVAVATGTPLIEALSVARASGVTRMPVFRDDLDHIIGVFFMRDAVPHLLDGALQTPVDQLMHRPLFVPESKRVSDLLRELRARRQTVAIVLDEYGGTGGLVTLHDLLEEIVGEIGHEFGQVQPPINAVDERHWQVLGSVSVDQLAQAIRWPLPEGEYDTVAGLVTHHLGRFPTVGESVQIDGVTVRVQQMKGRRILRVLVERPPAPPDDGAEGRPR